MNHIHLQQILPQVFAGRDTVTSQAWHQNIVFSKRKRYLVEAVSNTDRSSLCSYIYGCRQDYQGITDFDGQGTHSSSVGGWADIGKHSLSILFQKLHIFPGLTALENVLLKNRLSDYKKKKEIIVLSEATGVPDRVNEKADMLSFGQRQRVAFIHNLYQPFDFIFLGEPVSHLDDEDSAVMSQLLMEETEKQGARVIVTSIRKHLELPYDETLRP